jgi:predicted kinase
VKDKRRLRREKGRSGLTDATAEAAKKTGSYVADKASQAYDATTKAASHAVTEGGKLLDEAGTAIDQATQDAVKSLKGAWHSLSGG